MSNKLKTILLQGIIVSLFIISCGKNEKQVPLTVDKTNGSITFLAEVNGKYFLTPTRHCAVFKDGKRVEDMG